MADGRHEKRPLGTLIDDLEEVEDGGVTINGLLDAFQHRPVGALITLFAFIAALPVIGGLPGVSVATATLILLVQAKALTGQGNLSLPKWLGGETKLPEDTLHTWLERSRTVAKRVDRFLTGRLRVLTHTKAARTVMHVVVALLALSMYPLSLIPMGVAAPAIALVAFGLAMLSGDGVMALIGYLGVAATIGIGLWLI